MLELSAYVFNISVIPSPFLNFLVSTLDSPCKISYTVNVLVKILTYIQKLVAIHLLSLDCQIQRILATNGLDC
jgi:hypothetical protein